MQFQQAKQKSYDIVIVGGAIYGSSVAWFTANNPDFDGSILVVERDPSYSTCSTAHTNSCIRQQFSNPVNIHISQFGAEFIKNFRHFMGDDERVPEVFLQNFGYLYLANTQKFADSLKESQKLQQELGAGTRFMSAQDIAHAYPFFNLDGIIGANHNLKDEGYFDGNTLFDWWKRSAREKGVEYLTNEVVAMQLNPSESAVTHIELKTGEKISCGKVVNASGPRAILTSRMAGIDIPVEPRKRYTFIFDAARPLDRDLPLTIDPSGVHMRSDGRYYLAGCPPFDGEDVAVDYDDFVEDPRIWEEKAWPAIANRIPQFDAIKLTNMWVGHYAFNTFDQNAIVGPHTAVENFFFINGFSGHGLQQSPALGRGMSELLIYNDFKSLDLTAFSFSRIEQGVPFSEKAVI